MLRRGAAIGIALDGDADRVIVVDEHGNVVDGDAIMALCAKRLHGRARLPQGTLVTTIMSNLGLERAVASCGGKLVRTAVGDRYVVEENAQERLRLRRRAVGPYLIFLEHATTGDEIIAALQVLAIMQIEEQRPLSELASGAMQRVPQVLENATFGTRMPIESMRAMKGVVDKLERELGARGRIVVRWSGTEPKLRVMVEGEDERAIATYASEILAAARTDVAGGAPS